MNDSKNDWEAGHKIQAVVDGGRAFADGLGGARHIKKTQGSMVTFDGIGQGGALNQDEPDPWQGP